MSINRNGTIGGGVILATMVVAGVVASMQIEQIRFGGPIQVKTNRQAIWSPIFCRRPNM